MKKEMLFDYNDITFENSTLKIEIDALSDDVLLDECNYILSSELESEMMDNILTSYFKKGHISPEERRKAEGLYILANCDLAWEV